MIKRFLLLTVLVSLSLPAQAAAKTRKADITPLTKLDDASKKTLEGLTQAQTKQFASIRNTHGIIQAVDDVEKNFDRALVSCGRHNPDMAEPMRARMIRWKNDIGPVMDAGQNRLKNMIASQNYAKPAEVNAYLKLVDDAVAYKARDIKIIPIQSKKECRKLLATMDDHQRSLKKLLIENLGLKKRYQGAMKVLQVMAGAERGGAETAFVDTCLALHEAGLEIEIAARNNSARSEKLKNAGLKIHHLPFGGAMDLYTPFKLKQIIKDFNPMIVQTWMSRGSLKTPASKAPKRYLKVSRLGGYYNLKYYRTSDYFIANTPDIRGYLNRSGIDAGRTVHINNFAPEPAVAKALSKPELNTPEDSVAVLALARLHENKALDILIKSIEGLPQIHLWLAGEGPLRQELEELAANLGLESRVHFLGWREDRDALLQACDICVVPSRHEPFGNVFVQAWANRTPMITSNSKGPSQYVHDGEDGLVFPVDDVDALKNALLTLSKDEGLQRKIAEAGYQRYLNEFTKQKTVDAYLKFYQDILSRSQLG